MVNFEPAFKLLMLYEGGYANNKKDKGGETYRGIARNYWPEWVGWKLIDHIKEYEATRLNKLNRIMEQSESLNECVKMFYQKEFWNKNNLNLIDEQSVANFLLDFFVNSGFGVSIIQKLVDVETDNVCGSKTIKAINDFCNKLGLKEALSEMVQARVSYLKSLAGFNVFGDGWIRRAKSYLV